MEEREGCVDAAVEVELSVSVEEEASVEGGESAVSSIEAGKASLGYVLKTSNVSSDSSLSEQLDEAEEDMGVSIALFFVLLSCYPAILQFGDSAIPVLLCTLYYGCFPTVGPLYTCVVGRGRYNSNWGQEQARGERAGPWGGSFVVQR